jgi:AraC-like DNA-binding protein
VRSTRKAAGDAMDSILLQLFLEGGVQFGVGQRTTYAERGDIIVFDLAQPVDNINRKFHHISCMWPRSAIEAVVPNIGRWHGHCLPRDNPSFLLLRQQMISSYDLAPRFTPQEGRRVEEASLALAGGAMTGSGLPAEPDTLPAIAEVLTHHIKRHIRVHLGCADQCPEQIAHTFGISRRRLYQLLEPIGGIAGYQRHLRLQRCMADLQDPDQAHLQVSEIAFRWGFRHPATFNRNFRAAFGITPGEARRLAHKGDPGQLRIPSFHRRQERLQKKHHQWFQSIGI